MRVRQHLNTEDNRQWEYVQQYYTLEPVHYDWQRGGKALDGLERSGNGTGQLKLTVKACTQNSRAHHPRQTTAAQDGLMGSYTLCSVRGMSTPENGKSRQLVMRVYDVHETRQSTNTIIVEFLRKITA